jgi:fructosamine-3-kinase
MSEQAREILRAAGLDDPTALIKPVTGGVSSSTHAAYLSSGGVIVKQALAQLDVAQEWTADPARVVAEADGLEWFHSLTPHYVPRPIAVVPHMYGLILPMATEPCPDMRSVLLESPQDFNPSWARVLGQVLAVWHAADPSDAGGTSLDDLSRVSDLRVIPFYQDMARRWPEDAQKIEALADELLSLRTTVVHGDFTPKNVLCLPGGELWIIDTEVCHIGNPVLDTASMLAHLVLKSFHYRGKPELVITLAQARADFLAELPAPSVPPSLAAHIGVFLGVRVAGKAPVSYLGDDTRKDVEKMAHALLAGMTLEEACEKWLI